MRFLAFLILALPLASRPVLAVGACLIPPSAESLVEMYVAEDYERLNRHLNHLAHLRVTDETGVRVVDVALRALAGEVNRARKGGPGLSRWQQAVPGSPFPYLVRAYQTLRTAQGLTGDGRAQLSQGMRRGAKMISEFAQRDLDKALKLAPDSVDPLLFELSMKTFDGSSSEERTRIFEKILSLDPRNLRAYQIQLEGHTIRMGGSHEAMFRFARESIAAHPEMPELGLLLVQAHLEMARLLGSTSKYFAKDEHWQELSDAWQAIAEIPERSVWANSELARIAVRANRPTEATKAFQALGEEWDACSWSGNRYTFEKSRLWAYEHDGHDHLDGEREEQSPAAPAEVGI